MRVSFRTQQGNVLLTTVMIVGLVGIMLLAYMTLASRQHYLTMRSQTWGAEIPLAEAGVEEAMAHLNSRPPTLATNGWGLKEGWYVKQRSLGDGFFHASISTSRPPTIVSIGFGRIPTQTNYSRRVLMVTTRGGSANCGILAKQTITMSGGAYIDSYDSSDPRYSTNGRYDPARRRDQATVGSLSSLTPAISTGTGRIYGSVATGVGGTAEGNIGDGTWLAGSSGIQDGHFRDDLNMSMPDVAVPFTSGYFTPGSGVVNGTSYTYVLANGDYLLASLSMSGNKAMVVTGRARLHVTGSLNLSGGAYILILPGASLELYVGGPKASISGGGIINSSQQADDFALFGLPTLIGLSYSGQAGFVGRVYAPQADFKLTGNSDASGSFAAKSFSCSGGMGIHYDESLGTPDSGGLKIVSWEEL